MFHYYGFDCFAFFFGLQWFILFLIMFSLIILSLLLLFYILNKYIGFLVLGKATVLRNDVGFVVIYRGIGLNTLGLVEIMDILVFWFSKQSANLFLDKFW